MSKTCTKDAGAGSGSSKTTNSSNYLRNITTGTLKNQSQYLGVLHSTGQSLGLLGKMFTVFRNNMSLDYLGFRNFVNQCKQHQPAFVCPHMLGLSRLFECFWVSGRTITLESSLTRSLNACHAQLPQLPNPMHKITADKSACKHFPRVKKTKLSLSICMWSLGQRHHGKQIKKWPNLRSVFHDFCSNTSPVWNHFNSFHSICSMQGYDYLQYLKQERFVLPDPSTLLHPLC